MKTLNIILYVGCTARGTGFSSGFHVWAAAQVSKTRPTVSHPNTGRRAKDGALQDGKNKLSAQLAEYPENFSLPARKRFFQLSFSFLALLFTAKLF